MDVYFGSFVPQISFFGQYAGGMTLLHYQLASLDL